MQKKEGPRVGKDSDSLALGLLMSVSCSWRHLTDKNSFFCGLI